MSSASAQCPRWRPLTTDPDLSVPRPEMCGEVSCSMQLRLVEESLLVFAVPMSWFYLMFFAG